MQTRYEQMKLPIAGFSLKKLNYLETHRGVAYSCEVYVNKTLVGHLENRGDGGCTSFYPRPEQSQCVQGFVAKNDIKSIMVTHNIGGYASADQIRDIDAMEHLAEAEIDRIEFNNELKKWRKKTSHSLIASNAYFNNLSWKPTEQKLTLTQLSLMAPSFKMKLQAKYDEICMKIASAEYSGREPFLFINTPEQLIELGVNIKPEFHWPSPQ